MRGKNSPTDQNLAEDQEPQTIFLSSLAHQAHYHQEQQLRRKGHYGMGRNTEQTLF